MVICLLYFLKLHSPLCDPAENDDQDWNRSDSFQVHANATWEIPFPSKLGTRLYEEGVENVAFCPQSSLRENKGKTFPPQKANLINDNVKSPL